MLARLQRAIHRIEEAIVVALLGAMILLAGAQILLRNFLDSGLAWSDPLLRVLVLWLGLLGAMLATRENKHIRIDILSRYLPARLKVLGNAVTALFSAAVCAILAWHSGRFVHYEWQDGSEIFYNVPAWLAELILPVGFGIMALRFALLAWQSCTGERA